VNIVLKIPHVTHLHQQALLITLLFPVENSSEAAKIKRTLTNCLWRRQFL